MKSKKLINLIWMLFFCLGMIFTIVGIVICINTFNYENKVDTVGTITDISIYRENRHTKHQILVKYNVDDKEYESMLNSYSSSFYVGKEIDIYYDRDNPNKIGVKSLDYIFLIFPGMGAIFVIIGGTGLIVNVHNKRVEKYLKQNGNVIYARYVETILNTSYSVNGMNPYNIICEWDNVEEGKKYIFKSKNIWINPENIIKEKNIENLPVYIDLKNKKKYLVDIESLTENIVDLT